MAAIMVQLGCSQTPPAAVSGAQEKVDIGTAATTSSFFKYTDNVVPLGTMGNPVPGLHTIPGAQAKFDSGKELFTRNFTLEPGEVANANSCATCHAGGGIGGASDRFAQNYVEIPNNGFPVGSEEWLQAGGGLLNVGFGAHVIAESKLQDVPNTLQGGTLILSRRLSTMTAGTGYLAAIPEAQIVARASQQNAALGISGRVGRAGAPGAPPSPTDPVGRFGWKLRLNTVSGFNGGALVNEIGVSHPGLPALQHWDINNTDPTTGPNFIFPGLRFDPTPDITAQDKDDLDVFTSLTLAPAPASVDPLGYQAFKKAGCAECHWDGYTTTHDANDLPPELRDYIGVLGGGKRVPAYTDLLAHNMGVGKLENVFDELGNPALGSFDGKGGADGINETVGSDEYRTAPLWGLRFKNSFMHNGSAKTIDEAIRNHYYVSPGSNRAFDSEANEVVKNYLGTNYGKPGNLTPIDRALLTKFLRAL
jgi:mono/diheme cytochrome c family protein